MVEVALWSVYQAGLGILRVRGEESGVHDDFNEIDTEACTDSVK